MNDRVPTHAGRIKLRPVGGGSTTWLTYDMEMADDPTVIGTPLNKANLLSDTTANALDDRFDTLPTTPNEALALLANKATGIETQTYTGTGTYGSNNKNTLTFSHEPKMVVLFRQDYIKTMDAVILNWTRLSSSGSFARVGDTATSNLNSYTLTNSRKTLTWYTNSNDQMQMNESGVTYSAISFY